MITAIAGADPADWATPPVPLGNYQGMLTPGLHGVRVGVPRAYFWERLDGEVAATVETALGVLTQLGAEVQDLDLPGVDEAVAARGLIHSAEAYAYHATWLRERPDDYGAEFRARVTRGRDTMGLALVEAQGGLARVGATGLALLERVDVLATPMPPTPAGPFEATDVTLNGVVESYGTV